MSLIDDFTRGLAIYLGILSVLAIIGLISIGQGITALLLLIIIFVPLSIIAREYYNSRKKGLG